MLSMYPRMSASGGAGAGAADDDDGEDGESHVCYAVVVGCASLLLLCALLIVVSAARACAIAGAAVVMFGRLVSWYAPTGVIAAARIGVGVAEPARRRCACGLAAADAVPAFAYDGGVGISPGSSLTCTPQAIDLTHRKITQEKGG